MRNRLLASCAAICITALLTFTPAEVSAATILHVGSRGSEVTAVQTTLKELGYYTYSKTTGYYGDITAKAVKRFQKDNGLYADGRVGTKTISLLKKREAEGSNKAAVLTVKSAKVAATASKSTGTATLTGKVMTASLSIAADSATAATDTAATADETSASAVSGSAINAEVISPDTSNAEEETGSVSSENETSYEPDNDTSVLAIADKDSDHLGALDWFREVRYIWDRGENATITDVETGLSFRVKRTYGTNHADVEPLTKEDTATIKKIWGGFSWDRRAVVVQIGKYTIAASMTAMPHAGVDSKAANRYVSNRSGGYGRGINLDAVKDNGCNGHMDIHFKNSRTHSSNRMLSNQQNMVKKAAAFIAGLI